MGLGPLQQLTAAVLPRSLPSIFEHTVDGDTNAGRRSRSRRTDTVHADVDLDVCGVRFCVTVSVTVTAYVTAVRGRARALTTSAGWSRPSA
jgi:hypothetical protein